MQWFCANDVFPKSTINGTIFEYANLLYKTLSSKSKSWTGSYIFLSTFFASTSLIALRCQPYAVVISWTRHSEPFILGVYSLIFPVLHYYVKTVSVLVGDLVYLFISKPELRVQISKTCVKPIRRISHFLRVFIFTLECCQHHLNICFRKSLVFIFIIQDMQPTKTILYNMFKQYASGSKPKDPSVLYSYCNKKMLGIVCWKHYKTYFWSVVLRLLKQ